MAYCERLSEQLAIVATIDPVNVSGTTTSDVFSMELHRRALFILKTGAGATAGIGVAIQENAASAFTAGTGTLLSAAATAVVGASSQYIFEITAASLSAGFTWVRATAASVGAQLLDMTVLADVERYHPASDRDLASVVSIQATA